MTRRFLLLIFFLYSLLFLGLASRTGTVIALAIPFAVYLGAALIFIPGKPELTARRTLSTEHVTQGVTVTVRLEITNLGENVEELLVEDVPPAEVELVQGQTSAVATLSPGKTVDLEYEVKAKRGRYIFSYVQATATDYLGLFEKRVTLEAADDLLILPLVLKLHPIPIRPYVRMDSRARFPPVKSGQGSISLASGDIRPAILCAGLTGGSALAILMSYLRTNLSWSVSPISASSWMLASRAM